MTISEILSALGLSENEVIIYLAMLELGMAPVSLIARRAGLKRPTTYGVVKKLRKRGLTDCFLNKGIRLYSVLSPQALYARYADYLEQLKKALPSMGPKHETLLFKPRIGFFEGRTELAKLYHEAWNQPGELLAYVLPQKAADYFGHAWLETVYSAALPARGTRRIMANHTATDMGWCTKLPTKKTILRRIPLAAFSHELCIAQKTVYFFSFDEGYALKLTSADATLTQINVFDTLWKNAKPL